MQVFKDCQIFLNCTNGWLKLKNQLSTNLFSELLYFCLLFQFLLQLQNEHFQLWKLSKLGFATKLKMSFWRILWCCMSKEKLQQHLVQIQSLMIFKIWKHERFHFDRCLSWNLKCIMKQLFMYLVFCLFFSLKLNWCQFCSYILIWSSILMYFSFMFYHYLNILIYFSFQLKKKKLCLSSALGHRTSWIRPWTSRTWSLLIC